MGAVVGDIEDVVHTYGDTLYRVAYMRVKNAADAQDIVQETLMKYMDAAPKFVNAEHQKAWLIRVAINLSVNWIKSAWFRKTVSISGDVPYEHEEISDVFARVMELSQKYRVLIHLFYYEGYSTAEIARITRAKESTVRTGLTRARRILKEKL